MLLMIRKFVSEHKVEEEFYTHTPTQDGKSGWVDGAGSSLKVPISQRGHEHTYGQVQFLLLAL